MAALEKSVQAGFADLDKLNNTDDLKSLRTRQDVQELMRSVDGRSDK